MRKRNTKLYTLAVIPVFAVLYFMTGSENLFQDDSMWDISTYNYYQKGASFELMAFVCPDSWSDSLKEKFGCPTSGTTNDPVDDPVDEPELTIYSCQTTIEMSFLNPSGNYHTISKHRNSFTAQELINLSTGQEVVGLKGDIQLKCNWSGSGSINFDGSNSKIYVADKNSFKIIHTETNSLSDKTIYNNKLTTLGTFIISQSELDKIESQLDKSNKYLEIAIDTNINGVLSLQNGKSSNLDKLNHINNLKFTHRMNIPTDKQDVSNYDDPMKLEQVYSTHYNKNILSGTFDTSPATEKLRQVTFVVSMSNWASSQGSPLITIYNPSGTPMKAMGFEMDKKVGDKQYFKTHYSFPIDSEEGKWDLKISNPNRSFSCNVQQTCPTITIQNNDSNQCISPQIYNPIMNLCVSAPDDDGEIIETALPNMTVGLLWKVKDNNGNTLKMGNSFSDGGTVLPSLSFVNLWDSRYGSDTPFEKIELASWIKFDDYTKASAFTVNNYNVNAELSIVGDGSSGTIPKQFLDISAQRTFDKLPIGWASITNDNADTLADRSTKLSSNDVFTLQAKISGTATLNEGTKTHNLKFSDLTFTQEMRYVNNDKRDECLDKEGFTWKNDKCVNLGNDNTDKQLCEQNDGVWENEQCTILQTPKEQCESNGEFYMNNICYPNIDAFCASSGSVLNIQTQQCEIPTPSNQELCEQNGLTWINNTCIDPTQESEFDLLSTKVQYCNDNDMVYNEATQKCVVSTITTESTIATDTTSTTNTTPQLCKAGQTATECLSDLSKFNPTANSMVLGTDMIIVLAIVLVVVVMAIVFSRRRQSGY